MQRATLFFVSLIALAGCSSSKYLPTAALSPEARSRTFNASKDAVYEATLAYLVRAGHQIDVSNKESGVISTGYKEFEATNADDDRMRLTALVEEKSQGSAHVMLTITVEYLIDGVWTAENMDKPDAIELYKDHLQGIAQQLQE